jgi:hypothetical protein
MKISVITKREKAHKAGSVMNYSGRAGSRSQRSTPKTPVSTSRGSKSIATFIC